MLIKTLRLLLLLLQQCMHQGHTSAPSSATRTIVLLYHSARLIPLPLSTPLCSRLLPSTLHTPLLAAILNIPFLFPLVVEAYGIALPSAVGEVSLLFLMAALFRKDSVGYGERHEVG